MEATAKVDALIQQEYRKQCMDAYLKVGYERMMEMAQTSTLRIRTAEALGISTLRVTQALFG